MRRALIAIISLLLTGTPSFAQNLTLPKAQIYTAKGTGSCGFVAKKWVPVSKVGKKYKKISGTAALKSLCKSLLKKTKLNLKKIPSSSGILKSSSSANTAGVSSVSGTPPTIAEIASIGASNVFWRTGVVSAINSGSPSELQCSELFGSSTDGSSSGFPGCFMAQETGFVMQNIIQSGTTLCYMKNFPTREVQDDGGFSVVGGTLPGGDISQIFSPPSGTSPRFVKIHIGASGEEEGDSIGIFKIYSQAQNEQNGDQYRYDLVFCDDGSPSVQEYERTRISLAGELTTRNRHSQGGGAGESVIRALLTLRDGELVVNSDHGRTVQYAQVNGNQGYKSFLTLNADNEIENKVYSTFDGTTRKGFSIARFLGESAPTVRFLEGAYKEGNSGFGNFSIAAEYRDTYYAATENSSYAARLNEVNIESDSFYQSSAQLEDSSAPLSCNQAASVEIRINMNSQAMQSVSALCEADRLDGMDFCRDNALREAEEKFPQVCSGN